MASAGQPSVSRKLATEEDCERGFNNAEALYGALIETDRPVQARSTAHPMVLSWSEETARAESSRRESIFEAGFVKEENKYGKECRVYTCVQCGSQRRFQSPQFLFLCTSPALQRTTHHRGTDDDGTDLGWVPTTCCPECIDEIARSKASDAAGQVDDSLKTTLGTATHEESAATHEESRIRPDDVVGILTW